MMKYYNIIRRPVITEKATTLKDKENKYVFEVDRKANKFQIRNAVEYLFNVKVIDVQTNIVHGKLKRIGRSIGRKPNWKRAIVTLKEGYSIDFFGGL